MATMFKGKRKKKSIWHFLLPAGLALMAMVLVFFAIQEDVEISLKELELTEIGKNQYAFLSLEGSKVEMGIDGKNPYLSLERWGEEGLFILKMPYPMESSALFDNKVRFSTEPRKEDLPWPKRIFAGFSTLVDGDQPQIDIDFYPLQPREIVETINGEERRFNQLEDGGSKIEIILNQKPESNILRFPIETRGLEFRYQSNLTQEAIDNGFVRPENVVGSYAVYHENKRDHVVGQVNYKTGKAFHIYRPLIYDSKGNETWGVLDLGSEIGYLSITIDPDWLNEAIYPVTVDPTIGYDTIGGSHGFLESNAILGSRYSATTDGEGGSVTRINFYGSSESGNGEVAGAIYEGGASGAGILSPQSETKTVSSKGGHWFSIIFDGPMLESETVYTSAIFFNAGPSPHRFAVAYDSGTISDSVIKFMSFPNWPDPINWDGWVEINGDPCNLSIYASYGIEKPTVTTQAVSNIQTNQADGNGNITNTGGEDCPERGFVYSKTSRADPGNASPAASDYENVVNETGTFGTGAFNLTMTGIDAGVVYYTRAYAKNSAGYSYGDEVAFFIDTSSTSFAIKKADGCECVSAEECYSGFCSGGICGDQWILSTDHDLIYCARTLGYIQRCALWQVGEEENKELAIVFSWELGAPQESFRIQISEDGGFSEFIFNETVTSTSPSGSTASYVPNLLKEEAPLSWGNSYYWRVKVYDGGGNESEWSEIKSFTLDLYPHPYACFEDPKPSADEEVLFDGLQSEIYREGGIISYWWEFQGGDPMTSINATETVSFAAAGDRIVTLEVSDGLNSCTKMVETRVKYPLPDWKEVTPF